MTDRNKFEEMLERLINEDREGAEDLFHEIVVEKSRDIYESLLNEEEDSDEDSDEDIDEAEDMDDDEDIDEAENMDDDDEMDESLFGEADPSDDMLNDISMDDDDMGMDDDDMGMDDDDMGMDDDDTGMGMDDNADIEDTMLDIKDELESLRASLEDAIGDMEDSDGNDDMDMDADAGMDVDADDMDMDLDMDSGDNDADTDSGDDDTDDDDDDVKEGSYKKKNKKSSSEEMREYVEKIQGGELGSNIGGDNGNNTKSTVAGKNDMGGTTQNIARADSENGVEANKGQLQGSSLSDGSPKDMNTGNINVPGGKAGKTAFKKSEPGHGAEKKGKPDTADKSATSTLNKVSSRAK